MESTPIYKTTDTATSVAKRIPPSIVSLPLETHQQIIEYILTDTLHQDIIRGILVNKPRVKRRVPLHSSKPSYYVNEQAEKLSSTHDKLAEAVPHVLEKSLCRSWAVSKRVAIAIDKAIPG